MSDHIPCTEEIIYNYRFIITISKFKNYLACLNVVFKPQWITQAIPGINISPNRSTNGLKIEDFGIDKTTYTKMTNKRHLRDRIF